jgi:hypothetical protein
MPNLPRNLHNPAAAAAMAIAAYALLILPALAAHHFDLSTFIVAGDRFVDAAHTPSPIDVRAHSAGYDGEFFYRLALDPSSFQTTAYGVTLDKPAFRMGRILYPALAWAAAIGRPEAVPAALFGLNMLGIGAIAALASALAKTAGVSSMLVPAIVLWPGFLVCLTHDTAEITAAALMLGAILCYLQRWFFAYAIGASLATLARETTLPVFAGLLLYDVISARGPHRKPAIAAGVLLFLPFAAWTVFLTAAWRAVPASQNLARNFGLLPFAGFARMLFDCMTGARAWAPRPLADLIVRGIVLATSLWLAGFACLVAARLPAVLRGASPLRPLGAAWLLLAAMVALLSAGGPWVEPAGYLRATTEFYVVGCLVLAASGPIAVFGHSVRPAVLTVAGLAMLGCGWVYCTSQIGLRVLAGLPP